MNKLNEKIFKSLICISFLILLLIMPCKGAIYASSQKNIILAGPDLGEGTGTVTSNNTNSTQSNNDVHISGETTSTSTSTSQNSTGASDVHIAGETSGNTTISSSFAGSSSKITKIQKSDSWCSNNCKCDVNNTLWDTNECSSVCKTYYSDNCVITTSKCETGILLSLEANMTNGMKYSNFTKTILDEFSGITTDKSGKMSYAYYNNKDSYNEGVGVLVAVHDAAVNADGCPKDPELTKKIVELVNLEKSNEKTPVGLSGNAYDQISGCEIVSGLYSTLKKYYGIIEAIAIALLLIMSLVDFTQVVVSGKVDEDMKKAFSKFTTRIALACALLILPTLLQFVINLFINYNILEGNINDYWCNFETIMVYLIK